MSNFRLNPNLDLNQILQRFQITGRVEIDDLLVPGQAEQLRINLIQREDWVLVMNSDKSVYEITRKNFMRMTNSQKTKLKNSIEKSGQNKFQYYYETIRVSESITFNNKPKDLLTEFILFLNSDAAMNFFRKITGNSRINFADGQATSYSTGHFLTCHDDKDEQKNRFAAYVFSLSPQWRPEWGGLLMFHNSENDIEKCFIPKFGSLRLFSVPTPHSVSYVTPLAPDPRLSVTGWLRHKI